MICSLFDAPKYLFFAADIPDILYYSHIPSSIIALLIGFVVFFHEPKAIPNRLLLLITLFFALWTFSSLTSWTSIDADYIAFIWPAFAISSSMIAILSIYFAISFYTQQDIRIWKKIALLALIAPVLLFAHTNLSFSGFDLTNCDAFAYEGIPYKIYYTLLGFLAMLWIAIEAFVACREQKNRT